MMKTSVAILLAIALMPETGFTQGQIGSRSAVIFESYSLGDGLGFSDVSELTIPITFTFRLGEFGTLTASTGYAAITVKQDGQEDITLSGALDSEARLSINILENRLVLLVTGAAPTGMGTIESSKFSILPAIANDVIGFAAGDLGSGGYVGSGFAGAFPVGQMALGVGATFRQTFEYEPVRDSPTRLKPGSEVRLRTGLEGPVGTRSYLRIAGIFSIRQKDRIDDVTVNGVGNRFTGYVSFNQGIGATSLTLYTFGVTRSDPRIESTALGAAVLPRGNLFAFGAQWSLAVSRGVSFVPTAEYRVSNAAPDATSSDLEKLGSAVRFGAKLRAETGSNTTLVLQGSGLTGELRQLAGTTPFSDVSGFRAAVHFEVRR